MIEKVSTFKERFNQALSIRNIKPVELFEKTGISESTISQYRSGYAQPKEDKLLILSNALDVNPVWLLGLNVSMDNERFESISSPAAIQDSERIKKAMELWQRFENLSQDQQTEFLNFLDFLQSRS